MEEMECPGLAKGASCDTSNTTQPPTLNLANQRSDDYRFDGQILQSKKKKMPRYSTRLDPARRQGMPRTQNEEESGMLCDNATPCHRGACVLF